MTDYNVRARFEADASGYIRAVNEAKQATQGLGDAADQAGKQTGRAFDGADKSVGRAGTAAKDAAKQTQVLGDSASKAGDTATSAFDGVSDGIEAAGISLDGAAGDYSNLGDAAQRSGSQAQGAFDGVTDGIAAAGIELDGTAGSYSSLGDSAEGAGGRARGALDDMTTGVQAAGIQIDGAAGSFTDLGNTASVQMQKAAQGIRDYSSEMSQLGGALTIMGAGITGIGVAAATVGIQYNDLQQRTSAALEVMTGSAAAASLQMEELNNWMRDSPFPRETWLEAQQQLMAFGMEAEDVIPSLNGIQEAVAAIGGGNAEIMQLVDIIGQIEGQGKITGRELQRLGQMGVDAASIIGEQMGKTGEQIRDDITAGALDADTAIEALTTGMTEKFEGSAAALTDTWYGAVDLLRAAFRDLSADAFSFLVNPDGGGFLVDLANQASDLLYALGELPTPILNVAGGLGLAGGAAITAAGGFMLLAPQAVEAWDAFVKLSNATGATRLLDLIRDKAPGAGRALRNVGRFAGVAAGALVAMKLVGEIFTDDQIYSVEDMDTAVENLANTGTSSGVDRMFNDWATMNLPGVTNSTDDINDMESAMARLAEPKDTGDKINQWADSAFGWTGAAQSDLTQIEDKVESFGDSLAGMVSSGNIEEASNAFNVLADSFVANGGEVDDLIDLMPSYIESLMTTAEAAGVTITEQEALQWALSGVAPASIEAAGGVDELGDAAAELDGTLDGVISKLQTMGLVQRTAYESAGDHAAAIQAFNDALAENGATLDENTEAGRANRDAMTSMIDTGVQHAENLLLSGAAADEATDALRSTYDQIVNNAEAMGLTATEADALARELMGIEDKDIDIDTHFDNEAQEMAKALANEIEEIPEHKTIGIAAEEDGSFVSVQQKVDDLGNTVTVIVDAEGNATEVTEEIRNIDGHEVTVYVDDDGTVYELEGDLEEISQSRHSTTMEVEADTEGAQSDIDGIEGGEATVDANANTENAEVQLEGLTNPRDAPITGVPYAADAEVTLTETARQRHSNMIGVPYTGTAETALDNAVLPRTSDMTGVPYTSTATTALNNAVLPRDASMTGVPYTSNAITAMDNAVLPRTSAMTGVPYTANANAQLNNTANPRNAPFNATQGNDGASGWLSNLARPRTVRITAIAGGAASALLASGGIAGGGAGNYQDVLPRKATGGRLPYTGLGTDMILGRNRHGVPTAWVDDGEWVVREQMSRKYHAALGLINADHPSIQHLAGLTGGGQAGRTVGRTRIAGSHSGATSIDYTRLGKAVAAALPPGPSVVQATFADSQIYGSIDNRLNHHVQDANRAGRRNTGVR